MHHVDLAFVDRVAEARVSRRRMLGAGGAVAVAAGLSAACGGDTGDPESSGGTLRFGTSLPITSGLDPHVEQATGLAIFPKMYGYLLHTDPRDDAIVLDHAQGVEHPDAVTYVITLRPGVRFHDAPPADGRLVTAQDAVRSILRFRDHPIVVSKTWHSTVLDAADAVDARIVRIRTVRPYVYSLAELGAIGAGVILPSEVADQALEIDRGVAGSGPLRVERVDLDGTTRLARYDGYHAAKALVDALEWKILPDDEAKAEAIGARAVDVVSARNASDASHLADISSDIEVARRPALSYLSLGLRVDRPPYADERVRHALDLAIDRAELIREVSGGDGVQTGPVNPHLAGGFWSLGEDELLTQAGGRVPIDERRGQARALLEAAAAQGIVLRMQVADLPELRDLANALAAQLRRVGVTVEVDSLDQLRWFANYRRGAFEATLISHPPYESPDMPVRLYHSTGVDGSQSAFGFADPEIDRLVERSWGEDHREQRRATLLEAQRLMIERRPILQLFSGFGYSAAWRYVNDRRPELPGSLAQYHYRYWLDLPVKGRPD